MKTHLNLFEITQLHWEMNTFGAIKDPVNKASMKNKEN